MGRVFGYEAPKAVAEVARRPGSTAAAVYNTTQLEDLIVSMCC